MATNFTARRNVLPEHAKSRKPKHGALVRPLLREHTERILPPPADGPAIPERRRAAGPTSRRGSHRASGGDGERIKAQNKSRAPEKGAYLSWAEGNRNKSHNCRTRSMEHWRKGRPSKISAGRSRSHRRTNIGYCTAKSAVTGDYRMPDTNPPAWRRSSSPPPSAGPW